MKKLSREEMKMVLGGVEDGQPYTCTCQGGVGQWTYKGEPSDSQVKIDVGLYCSSNLATCGHYAPEIPS